MALLSAGEAPILSMLPPFFILLSIPPRFIPPEDELEDVEVDEEDAGPSSKFFADLMIFKSFLSSPVDKNPPVFSLIGFFMIHSSFFHKVSLLYLELVLPKANLPFVSLPLSS